MNTFAGGTLTAAGLVLGLFGAQAIAQSPGTADDHVAAAKAAAGTEHVARFQQSCGPAPGPGPALASSAPVVPRAAPERSTWYVEPVKVFDNLYFVGEK